MTTITFDRSALRAVYLSAFDNFAIGADDAAKAAKISTDEVKPILRELERAGLVVSTRVNGQRALTYQAAETYDTIDRQAAIRSFQKVYGKRGPITREVRRGATGARYTDEQIQKAIAMKIAGESWKAIGQALGIKATAYLSKQLKPQVEAAAKATKPAGKKTTAKTSPRKETASAKKALDAATKRTASRKVTVKK